MSRPTVHAGLVSLASTVRVEANRLADQLDPNRSRPRRGAQEGIRAAVVRRLDQLAVTAAELQALLVAAAEQQVRL